MDNRITDDNLNPEPTKTTLKAELFSWLKAIVIAGAVALFFNNFIIINAVVPTGSMQPTIAEDDRLIAFRLSYLFNDPNRFDIIIFPNPNNPNESFIKRIIGMPGETIAIDSGVVYVDGIPLEGDTDFIREPFERSHWGPQTVPENSFFVLGDNRNNSQDSRAGSWPSPFITQDDIMGRALFRYFRSPGMLQ